MTSHVSRRSLIKSLAATVSLGPLVPRIRWLERSDFDPWVEVNPGHIRHNLSEVARRVGGRPVLAVVKNNGYGLGHVNAARALEAESGISGFAVVKLSEAVVLRDGGIKKPVLWMGP